jgi:hypothetical protein
MDSFDASDAVGSICGKSARLLLALFFAPASPTATRRERTCRFIETVTSVISSKTASSISAQELEFCDERSMAMTKLIMVTPT